MAADVPGQPKDACPYPRPFPRGFHDCPAYHGRPFIGLNVHYETLPPVWTCRHLDAKRSDEPPGGFYAHCSVGDAAARVRLAEAVGRRQLDFMREVEQEVIVFELPYLLEIEGCKGRELMPDYMSGKPDPSELRAEMNKIKERLLADLRPFLEQRSQALARTGATVDASLEATRVWIDYLISRPSLVLESWDLPPDQLERIPDEVRGLLSPTVPAS